MEETPGTPTASLVGRSSSSCIGEEHDEAPRWSVAVDYRGVLLCVCLGEWFGEWDLIEQLENAYPIMLRGDYDEECPPNS